MDATWVDSDEALRTWCDRLAEQERIAVDTEANSMFAYHERVCLVQVSTAHDDLLIDPLCVDLAPLGRILESPSIQKVMHGADYDVLIFKRRSNISIQSLFDTMIAARVLGWPKCGLASLLQEHFEFRANKAFQRYDWGQRPLSPEALSYARYDTHFLLELADIQREALAASEHFDLFERACFRQTRVVPRPRTFDPDGYWKIKGARDLDEPGRSVLKSLFAWRERTADAVDRPPFRVMPDMAMLCAAQQRPASRGGLAVLKGMPKPVARRHGDELIALIRDAASTACPPPVRAPVDRTRVDRVDALKAWRKAEATTLGVEPEIVLDRASLMAVVEGGVDSLEDWERQRYGEGIEAALNAGV